MYIKKLFKKTFENKLHIFQWILAYKLYLKLWDFCDSPRECAVLLVLQSLSCVQDFATPKTAAPQTSCPSLSPGVCSNSCHWVNDTIQPSHPLSLPSPPALNVSQNQGFFQWVSSSYLVAKLLELHLQHQSFQWIFRIDFL